MSETYFFSKSELAFYPSSLKSDYINAGTFPSDTVEVSQEVRDEFNFNAPAGFTLGADDDGMPAWVEIPKESNQVLLSRELTALSEAYKSDVMDLNVAYLAAIVNDGPNEMVKQQAVRNQINDRRANYAADVTAAKEKYN